MQPDRDFILEMGAEIFGLLLFGLFLLATWWQRLFVVWIQLFAGPIFNVPSLRLGRTFLRAIAHIVVRQYFIDAVRDCYALQVRY